MISLFRWFVQFLFNINFTDEELWRYLLKPNLPRNFQISQEWQTELSIHKKLEKKDLKYDQKPPHPDIKSIIPQKFFHNRLISVLGLLWESACV